METTLHRDRLGRDQHGGVEQFTEAGGGDHARLVEQRLPGDQRRACGGGTLAGADQPGVDGEDQDLGAHPPRGPGEPARVAERFQVEHGQLGGVIRLHHS